MSPKQGTGTKVYIKSITVVSFKSFGDTKQHFGFGPGLNLIAGPNGAGKSNVLDAVSFALCAKPASLRVQHLSELQSTDTDEPCEVELKIASQSTGESLRIFTLEARILPDSTRQYKLDGKQKTMKDVKEFLRDSHLLLEDAFAVLHQSKVTELADNNSASVIASVISSASGAGRWDEEVSRAVEEISNTRKSLAAINQNVSLLEKAIALDEERVRAMDRKKQIEHDLEGVQTRLKDYALRKLASLQEDTDDTNEQLSRTEKDKSRWLEEKNAIEKLTAATQGNEDEDTNSVAKERVELLQKVTQAEEELQIEKRRLEQGATAELQLQFVQLQVQRFDQAHEQALRALDEKQEIVSRMEQDLKRLSRLGSQGGSKGHIQDIINGLENEIRAAEIIKKDQAKRVEEAALAITAAEFKAETLREKVRSSKERNRIFDNERSNEMNVRAELDAELERLSNERDKLEKLKEGTERKACVASALLGRLSGDEAKTPAWSLHSLFRFKSEERLQCEQYLEALSAITGSLQNVCVVRTTPDAGRLLELWQSTVRDSPFRRIWPLDRLTSPDVAYKQRKAQESFKSGEVTLPLDLLNFSPEFSKALKKAFGGYVIAANDRVARDLISKHGLWNVTLDGNVSRSGSVQGGWRGASGTSFIGNKIKCDSLWREVETSKTRSGELDQKIEHLRQAQEQIARKAVEEEARVRAQEEEIDQLSHAEVALFQAKLSKEESEQKLESLCQDLTTKQARLRDYQTSEEAGSEEEAFAKALEAAVDEETAQQNAVDEVLRKLEEAREEEATLREEMSVVLDTNSEERIRSTTAALEAHRQDLARVEALQASQLVARKKMLEDRAVALRRAQECEEAIRQSSKAAEKLEKQKGQLTEKRKALEEEIAELANEHEDDQEALKLKDPIEDEKQYAAAKARRRHLISEKKRLAGEQQRVTMDEQVAFKERVENLQVFKERAESILVSIEKLNEGIRTTRDKVQKANEATFKSIRTMFIDCCKSLLPDKRVDLVKVKEHVEDGVKFLFQNASTGVATGRCNQDSEWKSNLGELSGGQRTMLSLAFILTVAMNGRSSLYIMDEVDAALDEQNQRRVAALIKDVISKESQVLCVSHNRSFQMFSDTVIQLSRREGSSKADAVFATQAAQKKHRQK